MKVGNRMQTVSGTLSLVHNSKLDSSGDYPQNFKDIFSLDKSSKAMVTISKWPNYHATSLNLLKGLAKEIRVKKIWYKDESQRFHLKSFKALGGAYAVACLLQAKVEESTGHKPDIQQLFNNEFDSIVSEIVISCATDGNHGRSVAWGCQMFGCQCVTYIHRDVSRAREQAMQSLGATVIRITGNYDDSVKQADEGAKEHGRVIVSDTSYEGYMDIPKDVALGYSVLLTETITQLEGEIPTHVFIQGGVGGLASAICAYFWEFWGDSRPRFIVVEPENANCLQQSAQQGSPVVVKGDLETLMAGLACGKVSALAWEILETGADDFLTVNEEAIVPTMQLLGKGFNGDPEIEAGESAVAGLAALITARNDDSVSKQLGLDELSRIFILGTEGATDEELYQSLTGLLVKT